MAQLEKYQFFLAPKASSKKLNFFAIWFVSDITWRISKIQSSKTGWEPSWKKLGTKFVYEATSLIKI